MSTHFFKSVSPQSSHGALLVTKADSTIPEKRRATFQYDKRTLTGLM